MNKQDFLKETIKHIEIKDNDTRGLVDSFRNMAFQSRNLSNAADIYNRMLADRNCAVILTLAGSLISAGLKHIIVDMIENNMVDAIVSTGANIVDQDFFEALGFKHYIGSPLVDDNELRELAIDRIYDTYIDEDELRICDMTIAEIANSLEPRAWSSREFINEMAKHIDAKGLGCEKSIIYSAWKKGVPIFVPAFSDCSAGFGLVHHQVNNEKHLTIDSVADFRELTEIKMKLEDTGIFMLGGGVPKNFTQDIVVATDILGEERPMHKYAIQITVADERDGALSGSTLKEACSWGKVDVTFEQMLWSEATIALPLIAGDAYHRGSWKNREEKRLNDLF